MGKSSFPVITIANKTVMAFCFCDVPNRAKVPKNLHAYIWILCYTHLQQKKATKWGQIQADFYWADILTTLNIKKKKMWLDTSLLLLLSKYLNNLIVSIVSLAMDLEKCILPTDLILVLIIFIFLNEY